MKIHIFKNVKELNVALAEKICEVAEFAIKNRGEFTLVLSGGGSPKKLYQLLASETYKDRIDWSKTYFFFGDERFVPADDVQRNSLMIKKLLFEPLKIPASQIYDFDTSGTPEEAAEKYNAAIATHFQDSPIEFDFNLLGLGANSHTASLFPETEVLAESEAAVKAVFVNELDMYRLTMTAPLINQSRNIAFIVFGADKADAVYHVLEDETGSAELYPARLISTEEEKTEWFIDEAAATKLSKNKKISGF
ncbi:6-phosphogluconolactonase [Chryseobacterium sp. H3056]|uniref:6-phosphogluconolactonase n=1 Tax=Kaistella daneshvariae TaxID=2487074 RepID=A0A3N0WVF1_9FLAO|nr:6-phosphogluconolactonase [Kaistella daneshvariae]ROI09042.1 6-phosphogluconolactonase [Kaistella daneshvariae]